MHFKKGDAQIHSFGNLVCLRTCYYDNLEEAATDKIDETYRLIFSQAMFEF